MGIKFCYPMLNIRKRKCRIQKMSFISGTQWSDFENIRQKLPNLKFVWDLVLENVLFGIFSHEGLKCCEGLV